MGKPSYDDATLAEYFQPVSSELLDDPVVGPLLQRIAKEDPDIIAAVADVDRSQIRDALQLTPMERLQAATARWNMLRALRTDE